MAKKDDKEVVPVNLISPSESNWPKKSVTSASDWLKNWAGLLTAVAALLASGGTYLRPSEDPKYKESYEVLKERYDDQVEDIERLESNVKYLYRLREEEDRTRRVAATLETSAYEIEDNILRRELETRYGKKFADEYMDKRAKNRREIRQEYVGKLNRKPPRVHDTIGKKLPPYGQKE